MNIWASLSVRANLRIDLRESEHLREAVRDSHDPLRHHNLLFVLLRLDLCDLDLIHRCFLHEA